MRDMKALFIYIMILQLHFDKLIVNVCMSQAHFLAG